MPHCPVAAGQLDRPAFGADPWVFGLPVPFNLLETNAPRRRSELVGASDENRPLLHRRTTLTQGVSPTTWLLATFRKNCYCKLTLSPTQKSEYRGGSPHRSLPRAGSIGAELLPADVIHHRHQGLRKRLGVTAASGSATPIWAKGSFSPNQRQPNILATDSFRWRTSLGWATSAAGRWGTCTTIALWFATADKPVFRTLLQAGPAIHTYAEE